MNGESKAEPFDRKPGWRSWSAVSILLGEVLIEGIKLPLRFAVYMFKRKAIKGALEQMLEGGRTAR